MKLVLVLVLVLAAACGDDGGPPTPDAPPPPNLCLDPDVLAELDALVQSLTISADMLRTHPGPLEAVGFFAFPELELSRTAVFAGPLVMECNGAFMYDEYCEPDGLCSRIECTGVGTGWIMHFYLQQPVAGAVTYSVARVDTAWLTDATGITFTTEATTTAGAHDWSMTGSGVMDLDRFSVELSYPALSSGGAVVLTAGSMDPATHSGTIVIGEQLVASADPATGRFAAAPQCQ